MSHIPERSRIPVLHHLRTWKMPNCRVALLCIALTAIVFDWATNGVKSSDLFTTIAAAQDIPDDFGPPVVRSKPVYLSPENFTPNDGFAAFREHAHEFLREHPDHLLAPRALHDLILIQTTLPQPDPNVANALKVRLALEYPESLAMHFTIKSFRDPAEFRNLLATDFRKPEQVYSREYCRRFLKACEIGLNAFGPGFVHDDGFQLQIRLALSEGKSFRLNQINETHAEKMKQLPKAGLEICQNPNLSPVERVTALHQLIRSATPAQQSTLQGIRDAECFWMSRLSEKDRQEPGILTILVEKDLEQFKFEPALPKLAKLLAKSRDPKLMFWYAWCMANVDDADQFQEAIRTLDLLIEQFPQDPWAKVGTQLAATLRDKDLAIQQQSAVLLDLVKDMTTENLEELTIRAQYRLATGKSLDLTAHADVVHSTLDAFLRDNEQPLVGYKASLKEYSLFLKDNPEVVQISKPGLFPDLTLGLELTTKGPSYKFNFNTQSTLEAAQSWRRALLSVIKSPVLANQETIQGMLRLSALHSGFPKTVTTQMGRRSLVWVTPAIHTPELKEFELEVGPEGNHELAVKFSQLNAQIRYGKSGSIPQATSPWNGLPVVQKNEFDLALIMRAISLAASIFNPTEPAETSATSTKPAPAIAPANPPPRDNEVKVKTKLPMIAQPVSTAPRS